MSKITGKKYYKIEFINTSPLGVGSGENTATDKDVMLDSNGHPYIPGTALAGVYRRLFSQEEADRYFGPVLNLPEEERQKATVKKTGEAQNTVLPAQESQILVYNADLVWGEPGDGENARAAYYISSRDMVGLDAHKAARKGAKFDFQIVEPGVTFVTYIEQNLNQDTVDVEDGPLERIAAAWKSGEIQIGGKTGRGYGCTRINSIHTASFLFQTNEKALEQESGTGSVDHQKDTGTANTKGIAAWLDFSMYGKEGWTDVTKEIKERQGGSQTRIQLELAQAGGLAVRRYSSVGDADYEQLTVRDVSAACRDRADAPSDKVSKKVQPGIPVIPGTSWAGAFRAQMGRFHTGFDEKLFFGEAKSGQSDGKKTCVSFGESRIQGGNSVLYTRNAIDRFTGGVAEGALYTEKAWYGGTMGLEITIDNFRLNQDERYNQEEKKKFCQALSAAIADLHEGYMAVGGLTAVGKGLFRVNHIAIQDGEKAVDISLGELLKGSGEAASDVKEERSEGECWYQWLTENLIKEEH